MKLWYNHRYPEQQNNLREFERLMHMNQDVTFMQPNRIAAPWHVQAWIGGVQLDVWPHLLKGRIGQQKAKVGYRALQRLIQSARDTAEDIHLLEE